MVCRGACNEHEIEHYYDSVKEEATIEHIISEIEEKLYFCEKEAACLHDLAEVYRDLIKTLEEKKPVEDQGG